MSINTLHLDISNNAQISNKNNLVNVQELSSSLNILNDLAKEKTFVNVEELASKFNVLNYSNDYAKENNILKPEEVCKDKHYIQLIIFTLSMITCCILLYLLYLYSNDIDDGHIYNIYIYIKHIISLLLLYYFKDLLLLLYKVYWNLLSDFDKLTIILSIVSMILNFLVNVYRNITLSNYFTKGKIELLILLGLFTILSFYKTYPFYENIKQHSCNNIVGFYYLNKFIKPEHILLIKSIINYNMNKK
jgi:hypothetical protein